MLVVDKVFEDNDVKIIVDKKSFLYLVGTTLEFSGRIERKGVCFQQPKRQAEPVAAEKAFLYYN